MLIPSPALMSFFDVVNFIVVSMRGNIANAVSGYRPQAFNLLSEIASHSPAFCDWPNTKQTSR